MFLPSIRQVNYRLSASPHQWVYSICVIGSKERKVCGSLSREGAVQHDALRSWVSLSDLQRGRN